jgi:hypothetical protein
MSDHSGDRSSFVFQAKERLIDEGIIPVPQTTECHAFLITAGAAWLMKEEGAKLMIAGGSTHCLYNGEKFSLDGIGFEDGWADCLVSAGPGRNLNGPTWQWHVGAPTGRTVAPFNPFKSAVTIDPPLPPAPPPAPVDPVPSDPPPIPTDLAEALAMIGAMAADIKIIKRDINEIRTGRYMGVMFLPPKVK